MSANEKLIKNLENQVGRVVQQLKDLEECRDELSAEEFESMKEETLEQIKDFSDSLTRMNKGDLSTDTKISQMREEIRTAIVHSFNTVEMIKMFGLQNANDLERQLLANDEEYKLKRITQDQMEAKKILILEKLKKQGHSISAQDLKFLENKNQQYMQQLEILDE